MFFFQGLTMGLAYVAPIGMQNLFVIHSALSHSLRRAVVTALIVLFFDISLSLSCFYGIGSLLDHLPWLKAVILGAGTLLILYMAYGMIRQVPDALTLKGQPASLGQTVSKACIVTWMNPQAILDGTMLLGAFRITLPAAEATLISSVENILAPVWVWIFVGETASPATLTGGAMVLAAVMLNAVAGARRTAIAA